MRIISALALLTFGGYVGTVLSFDIHTHTAMTAKAIEQSQLGSTPNASLIIARLGLRDSDGVFSNRYVGFGQPLRSRVATTWEGGVMNLTRKSDTSLAIPPNQSIAGWIMRGAVREDDNTAETPRINETDNDPTPVINRVFGHFHDPVNNLGLRTPEFLRRGPMAADWALDPAARIPEGAAGGHENFYRIGFAREAMWRALTFRQVLLNGELEELTTVSGNPSAQHGVKSQYCSVSKNYAILRASSLRRFSWHEPKRCWEREHD